MKSIFFTVLMLLAGSAYATKSQSLEQQLKNWQSLKLSPKAKLEKFYELTWKYSLEDAPEAKTYLGLPGSNDRWSDLSFKAIERRKNETHLLLKALQTVSPKTLRGEDLISYQISLRSLQEGIEGENFPHELMPINQMGGIQQDLADMMTVAPKLSLNDYRDRIRRLEASPVLIEQTKDLLKEGLRRNITPPQVTLVSVPKQFDQVLTEKVEDSPLFESFKEIPSGLGTPEEIKAVQDSAKLTIKEKVYPALKQMSEFFKNEYLPKTRTSLALSALPEGEKWYNYKIKKMTTVNKSAEEIHALGLSEVARIRAEMEALKNKIGFKGSFDQFNKFLKEDSQFFYDNPKDLVAGYREIAKKIDPELPRLFSVLPRLTYGVREMPAFKAPSAPTAYYMGGSLEAGRPGYFEANTFNLKARPKWQMEDLTLHEAVPGHHLQIAIAQELQNLPEFRKNDGPTAFVEGWGLYAESLGSDLGLFQDPYSKYGQLSAEIWRAIRLVVDTGLHAKGWTRDQVIQYFRDNSGLTEQNIIAETDRYITWPGQALAYKIGELKFKELKTRAQKKLGNKFDIRKFHDELLGSGAVPLDVIETKIDRWIEQLSQSPRHKTQSEG